MLLWKPSYRTFLNSGVEAITVQNVSPPSGNHSCKSAYLHRPWHQVLKSGRQSEDQWTVVSVVILPMAYLPEDGEWPRLSSGQAAKVCFLRRP